MMPEKDNDAQGGRRSCGWREDCDVRDVTVVSDPRCIAGAGLADLKGQGQSLGLTWGTEMVAGKS